MLPAVYTWIGSEVAEVSSHPVSQRLGARSQKFEGNDVWAVLRLSVIRDSRGSIAQAWMMLNFHQILRFAILREDSRVGVQELLGNVSSSELSSHQMAIRGFMGLQKVIASLISSELSSHQMAIRSLLGVSPHQLSSNHFGVFGPTGCIHWGLHPHTTGSGPVRGVLPPGTSPSSAYEGEAVDTVTPAGLPQEPSPFEEDKLLYATSMSASIGPGGEFRRGLRSLA